MNEFCRERDPRAPFGILIRIAAACLHPGAGRRGLPRRRAQRHDDQEMRAVKAELRAAVSDGPGIDCPLGPFPLPLALPPLVFFAAHASHLPVNLALRSPYSAGTGSKAGVWRCALNDGKHRHTGNIFRSRPGAS